MSILSRLDPRKAPPVQRAKDTVDRAKLELECAGLRERLAESEALLEARSRLLYDLQQQYSSEHFDLQKYMRDLKTEEMRGAGAFATLEITLERARALQKRIARLKDRLRKYETVDDEHFDTAPIRVEPPRTGEDS